MALRYKYNIVICDYKNVIYFKTKMVVFWRDINEVARYIILYSPQYLAAIYYVALQWWFQEEGYRG